MQGTIKFLVKYKEIVMSKIFLDLDGCFADFAGEISAQVNALLSQQSVIKSPTANKALKKLRGLGVTQVIPIDFSHANLSVSAELKERLTKREIDKRRALKSLVYKIANIPGFFLRLGDLNSKLLIEVANSGKTFCFLSAPMENEWCVAEKREWVRRTSIAFGFANTDRFDGLICCPASLKVEYASQGVLFDDRPKTINAWRDAGGVAFLCPDEISKFREWLLS